MTTDEAASSTGLTAARFLVRLEGLRSDAELEKIKRFFPASHDTFIGVRMGDVFALAREFGAMDPAEVERLLESPIHEARAGAIRIMADQARHPRVTAERRRDLYELYLRRMDRIDEWDLVDLGAWHVVGRYLVDHPRGVLDTLAASGDRWARRTAILATFALIQRGEIDDAERLAERLVDDEADTVQKGVGWVLRAIGDADPVRWRTFLDRHAATMVRATLRAALEHAEPDEWADYLARRSGT